MDFLNKGLEAAAKNKDKVADLLDKVEHAAPTSFQKSIDAAEQKIRGGALDQYAHKDAAAEQKPAEQQTGEQKPQQPTGEQN